MLAAVLIHGITLNAEKFALARPAVKFCGFMLSMDGIAADPDQVRAIAEFATPANITDLRSFIGLVNQLPEFSPEISTAASGTHWRDVRPAAQLCSQRVPHP